MTALPHITEPLHILPLSAASSDALEKLTEDLCATLKTQPQRTLAEVARELQSKPASGNARRIIVSKSPEEAVAMIERREGVPRLIYTNKKCPDSPPPVAFMFPGQGAQYAGMGNGLYQSEPLFRETIDRCATIVQETTGIDLKKILFPNPEENDQATKQISETAVTQPALFTIEYALAKLWISKGITPDTMIGHSIGEYAAACIAGVFTLEEALPRVCTRARLMQEMPAGLMVSFQEPQETIEKLIKGTEAAIATLNAPGTCVISGTFDAVEQALKKADEQSILYQRLRTSHAFHSSMMEPAQKEFLKYTCTLNCQSPKIPFISNLTGTWFSGHDAQNPRYWADHLRYPVLFSKGMQQLMVHNPNYAFLEIGPGNTLCTLTRQHMQKPTLTRTIASLRHPKEEQSDTAFFTIARGKCWLAGIDESLSCNEPPGHTHRNYNT